MRQRIVLLSGGMDSSLLLLSVVAVEHPGWEIGALAFDYGQTHADAELNAATKVCALLNVTLERKTLPDFVGLRAPGSVIPSRNLIFAAIAANAAQHGEILFGFCAEDQAGFPDCRPDFLERLNQTLALAELDVTARAPFIRTPKAQIVRLYAELPQFDEVLALSYSCYFGGEKHCGQCPACVKRLSALDQCCPEPTPRLDPRDGSTTCVACGTATKAGIYD